MQRRPVISVVISALVVALVCGSFTPFTPFTPFIVFALPRDPSNPGQGAGCEGTISLETGDQTTTCCWTDKNDGKKYCQKCTTSINDLGRYETDCDPKQSQIGLPAGDLPQLEQVQPPILQPVVPQEGIMQAPAPGLPVCPGDPRCRNDLPLLEQADPTPPVLQPALPKDGVLEAPAPPPPATEQTQPATVEEEQSVPVCQEGLEFNEDLGFCVPEDCPEGQVLDEESGICVLEEPEAPEEEPEQQSSEEDGSEDNSNNGDDASN